MPSASGDRPLLGGVAASLTAAGSSQTGATVVTGDDAFFSTVPVGAGCILQAANAMDWGTITNGDTNTLAVYPPVGGAFNGGATNAPVSLPGHNAMIYRFVTPLIIVAVWS